MRWLRAASPLVLVLLLQLRLNVAAAEFEPVESLGKDLACSACTLVVNSIEAGLEKIAKGKHKRRKKKKKKQKVTSLLKDHLTRYCQGLKNMAIIGADGSREYVDLAMALGEDANKRRKTNLNNVKMGPEVAVGLRDSCVHFSNTYTSTMDIEKATKTVRTLQELNVFSTLCIDTTAACTPKKDKPLTKKGAKNAEKKRKYMENRPFLVGRARVEGEKRFCETCAIVVEEVHKALVKEVDRVRRSVTAGKEEKHDFNVPKILAKLCNVNLNAKFKELSPAVQSLCAEVLASERHIDLFARHFSGSVPTALMAFERKGLICGALHPECKVLPSALAERTSVCDSCLLAVRDVYSVVRRTSGRKDYASKKHVWEVLDTICTEMEMRHPQAIAQQVQEQCEVLMEDFDSEVAAEFLTRVKASGSEGKGKDKGSRRRKEAEEAEEQQIVATERQLEDAICTQIAEKCAAGSKDEL